MPSVDVSFQPNHSATATMKGATVDTEATETTGSESSYSAAASIAQLASCSICCQDNVAETEIYTLVQCSHTSCRDCLQQWITKVEASGQDYVGCPFCRIPLTSDETSRVLGRSFEPTSARSTHQTENGESELELDDLTRQWLAEQTKPCPRCGAYIEKIEGGCDMMECLCGYRFCYGCGAQNAACGCTPQHHSFWDNVLDRNAGHSEPQEAPVDEATGRVTSLVAHIQTRKKKDSDDQLRISRKNDVYRYQRELLQADALDWSGKWLFLPETSTIRVLTQMTAANGTRVFRARQRNSRHWEVSSVEPLVYSARWLFCHSRTRMLHVLAHQRKAYATRRDREWKANHGREEYLEENNIHGVLVMGSWLYTQTSAAKTRTQIETLFQHMSKLEDSRASKYCFLGECSDDEIDFEEAFFGHDRMRLVVEDGCGCLKCSYCGKILTAVDEEENALTLRSMFRNQNDEEGEQESDDCDYD